MLRAADNRLSDAQRLAIDGLRGFLALWVVCYHFQHSGAFVSVGSGRFLNNLFSFGYLAVSVFFSLSGFLIYRSYSDLRSRCDDRNVPLRFYLRRIFRIWPVWFVVLVLYDIKTGGVPIQTFFWNFFFIFGFQPFKWTDLMVFVSWSLFVEEMFYFSFPLLFRLLECGVFVPLFILSLIVNSYWWSIYKDFVSDGYHWMTPAETFPYFFIGIGFNFIFSLIRAPANWVTAAVTDFTIAISFAILVTQGPQIGMTEFLSAILLFCALCSKGLFNWIFVHLFRRLGPRCYCIYLIHPYALNQANRVRARLSWLTIPSNPTVDVVLHFILMIGLNLLFAEVLHRLIELPAQKLGRRLSEKSDAPSPSGQPSP